MSYAKHGIQKYLRKTLTQKYLVMVLRDADTQ